jgi:hypothetical protein
MVKIKFDKDTTYEAEGVKLFPGINNVESDKADKFLKNPGVIDRIKKKIIIVGERIDELTENDILNDMPNLFDVIQLRKFAEDANPAIAAAAKAQLATIDAMAKDNGKGKK